MVNGVVQGPIRRPESDKGDRSLHEDALQDMTVNLMAEFVGEYGFDLVGRVIVEQCVGENDSSRAAQAGECGIGLLALLRQFPAIDSADLRAGALAEHNEAPFQIFVVERLEFVEDGEQENRGELREQYEQAHEQGPSQEPPVLRPLPDREIQQLDHYGAQNQADQESLDVVPQPRAEPLGGKFIGPLHAKSVVVKADAEYLADAEQKHDVNEQGQRIVLESHAVAQSAKEIGPAHGEQHNQEHDSHGEVGDAEPSPDAVIAACFWRIALSR